MSLFWILNRKYFLHISKFCELFFSPTAWSHFFLIKFTSITLTRKRFKWWHRIPMQWLDNQKYLRAPSKIARFSLSVHWSKKMDKYFQTFLTQIPSISFCLRAYTNSNVWNEYCWTICSKMHLLSMPTRQRQLYAA